MTNIVAGFDFRILKTVDSAVFTASTHSLQNCMCFCTVRLLLLEVRQYMRNIASVSVRLFVLFVVSPNPCSFASSMLPNCAHLCPSINALHLCSFAPSINNALVLCSFLPLINAPSLSSSFTSMLFVLTMFVDSEEGNPSGTPLALGGGSKDALSILLYNGVLFVLISARISFEKSNFVRPLFNATDLSFEWISVFY